MPPPPVQGTLRAVDSTGPWAGGSLAAQLKVVAAAQIEHDAWLKQGVAGACRPHDVELRQQQHHRQQQQQAGMMMNTEQTGMNQFIPGVQANNAINGFLNAGQMSGMGNNILMQQAMQQQQQQSMMGMNAGGPGGVNIGAAGGGNGVSQEMLQSWMQRNEGGAAPQGQAHG